MPLTPRRWRRTRRAVRSAGPLPPISRGPAPPSTAASTSRCRMRCAAAFWRRYLPRGNPRHRRPTRMHRLFRIGGVGGPSRHSALVSAASVSAPRALPPSRFSSCRHPTRASPPAEPRRTNCRRPYPRDAARPSGRRRIERPAHGEALVRWPPRLCPAGKGFCGPAVFRCAAAGSTMWPVARSPRSFIGATSTSSTCSSGRPKTIPRDRRKQRSIRAIMSCTGHRTAWCSGRFPMSRSANCGILPGCGGHRLTGSCQGARNDRGTVRPAGKSRVASSLSPCSSCPPRCHSPCRR